MYAYIGKQTIRSLQAMGYVSRDADDPLLGLCERAKRPLMEAGIETKSAIREAVERGHLAADGILRNGVREKIGDYGPHSHEEVRR